MLDLMLGINHRSRLKMQQVQGLNMQAIAKAGTRTFQGIFRNLMSLVTSLVLYIFRDVFSDSFDSLFKPQNRSFARK
jgi:hypothetical protein